jgi:hypothetical protein
VTSAIFAGVFSGAMPVICRERILREFRADSPLRNYFSKKKSIASELAFSNKKKGTCANGEIVGLPGESADIKNDCKDTGEDTKG